MSTQTNKGSLRTIAEEGFQKGNLDALDKVVASDYIEHFPVPPGWPAGLAGLKQFITLTRNAFPDLHYTVEDMIADSRGCSRFCHANMIPCL